MYQTALVAQLIGRELQLGLRNNSFGFCALFVSVFVDLFLNNNGDDELDSKT